MQDPEYTKDLMCKYRAGGLPYIVYKEEVLSWSPRISMFYDVMSDMEAEMLKAKAYPLVRQMFLKLILILLFIYLGFNVSFNTLYRSYHDG